jgi:hypothetical protein
MSRGKPKDKNAGKMTAIVATPIISTPNQDSTNAVHESREATRHNAGKPTLSFATRTDETSTRDSIFANMIPAKPQDNAGKPTSSVVTPTQNTKPKQKSLGGDMARCWQTDE